MMRYYVLLIISFFIYCLHGFAQNDEWAQAIDELKLTKYYVENNDGEAALQHIGSSIDIVRQQFILQSPIYTYEEKSFYWQQLSTLFDDIYPSIVFSNPKQESIAKLYNAILFSKNIMETYYTNQLESYDWKLIEKQLTHDDIAIEFIDADEFFITNSHNSVYYALILKKNQSPQIIRLFDNNDFIEALTHRKNTAREVLSKLVWYPIMKEIGNIKNIYFAPTNFLAQVPIEYLPINNGELLSDKYNLYRLSSTARLLTTSVSCKYKKAILYGGINYEYDTGVDDYCNFTLRSGFDFLSNTAEEVDSINNILQAKNIECVTYTGTDATEMSLKKLSAQDIDILHIATHGIYVSNEQVDSIAKQLNITFLRTNIGDNVLDENNTLLRSFLVMANGNQYNYRNNITNYDEDGLLTAAEISLLDFKHIDLVTLSACESGKGEFFSYGIVGLQRAFKRAGANTIIMSLDKVNDEATKILMIEFYKNLLSGKTKHQSLHDAQHYLRIIENGKYDDPMYWEPFIMLDGLN